MPEIPPVVMSIILGLVRTWLTWFVGQLVAKHVLPADQSESTIGELSRYAATIVPLALLSLWSVHDKIVAHLKYVALRLLTHHETRPTEATVQQYAKTDAVKAYRFVDASEIGPTVKPTWPP